MSPATTTTRISQEDEIAQLRARVASLEAELSRQRASSTTARSSSRRSGTSTASSDTPGDTVDRAADSIGRKLEESSRLLRAVVLAGLEPLRITADATQAFVDEVIARNPTDEELTVGDLATRLPRDLYAGVARALELAADSLPDTVDTFHERYQTARPIRVRRTGSRAAGTRGAVTPRVIATVPANGTSASAPDSVTVTFNTDVVPGVREFNNSIVVRKDSVVIAGTESQTSTTTLSWKPAVTLTPGVYTVGVFNVQSADSVNMPEPFYFSFTVTS